MKPMKKENTGRAVLIFFIVMFALFFFIEAAFMPIFFFDEAKDTYRIVPDLLLSLSIVCGMLYPEKGVVITALVCGTLCDVFLMPPMHLSPLLFFLGAYFASRLASFFVRKNALTALAVSLPFFLLRAVSGGLFLLAQHKEETFGHLFTHLLLPEFAVNALSAFVTYLVVSWLFKRFKKSFYIL